MVPFDREGGEEENEGDDAAPNRMMEDWGRLRGRSLGRYGFFFFFFFFCFFLVALFFCVLFWSLMVDCFLGAFWALIFGENSS